MVWETGEEAANDASRIINLQNFPPELDHLTRVDTWPTESILCLWMYITAGQVHAIPPGSIFQFRPTNPTLCVQGLQVDPSASSPL